MQSYADTRRIPINRLGVKDINHPVRIKDRSGREQHTIANFNMYVSLPHEVKGTYMPRFVEILHHESPANRKGGARLALTKLDGKCLDESSLHGVTTQTEEGDRNSQ